MNEEFKDMDLANTTIHIDDIKLPGRWNRIKMSNLDSLVQSIQSCGQLVPIVVRVDPDEEGKVILVDGKRRLSALRELGKTQVIISFTKSDTEGDAYRDSMVANSNSEPNTPYELALSYDLMVDTDGKTHEEIAHSCGKTSGHVSQLRTALRIAKTDPELLKAFQEDKVPPTVFRYLSKLDPETDAKMLRKMIISALKGVSGQRISEKIDAYLASKKADDKKKRGAAAHKREAISLIDYSNPEISKNISPIKSRTKYQELLMYQTEEVRKCTKKTDQQFARGVLLGLEMGAGLIQLSDDY